MSLSKCCSKYFSHLPKGQEQLASKAPRPFKSRCMYSLVQTKQITCWASKKREDIEATCPLPSPTLKKILFFNRNTTLFFSLISFKAKKEEQTQLLFLFLILFAPFFYLFFFFFESATDNWCRPSNKTKGGIPGGFVK